MSTFLWVKINSRSIICEIDFQQQGDIIGERIKEGNSGLQNSSGKDKALPKDYLQKDTFQHFRKIAKHAGYVSRWLELQKEIASLLHEAESEKDIEEIHMKEKNIIEYTLAHYEKL